MREFIAKFFDKTFLRFVIAGVINTLFGTGIMFVFYNVLNLSYWISTASNYFFGSVLSYFLNKYFTFESRDNSIKSIVLFAVNITVCYLAAYGAAKPIAAYVFSGLGEKLQGNISMLIGMCLFVALNYLGQRFIVFKKGE